MTARTLLIRADASVAIGTGHVMRCLALAQAWRNAGGRAVFASVESTAAIQERLLAESYEVVSISTRTGSQDDAQQTTALAQRYGATWIVADGYQFTAEYQHALKSVRNKLLVFDDYGHAQHYWADVVVNQNVGADETLYRSREAQTRLLLGPKYCILRREFNVWREWKREIAPLGRRVLVMMGGSDPENVTAKAMEGLSNADIKNLEAIVVVGGSNPNFDSLQQTAVHSGAAISVRRDASNIAELMAWADIAVSAAGSTCWELCLLALPSLLVDVAENQTALAKELDRLGCARYMGNSRNISAEKIAGAVNRLLYSQEERLSLSQRSRELVDGEGAARVVSGLLGNELRLRRAEQKDSRQLWEWANDPQVRAVAFSKDAIPWEQHELWFASKMSDPDCQIFVAEDKQGRAVGQFRVDWRSSQDGEIDVSVAKENRGQGFGARLIRLGANAAFAGKKTAQLHAFVLVQNQASRRAFEAAHFRSLGEEAVKRQPAIHYILENKIQS